MLSTLCSIQTFGSFQPNAVARLSCPIKKIRPVLTPLIQHRSISFGNLGQKLDQTLEKIRENVREKAVVKKTEGISTDAVSTDAIFANRILTYANDGHLKLDFMGRVVHQELIDHEINREFFRRRGIRFASWAAVSGVATIVSWAFGIILYYPPDWLIFTMFAAPASAFCCSAIVSGSDEKFEQHKATAYRLYNEICLKYQTPSSPFSSASSAAHLAIETMSSQEKEKKD